MTKEELKNIIEQPLLANQETLTELLELSRQYPYCAPLQTLIILLLHQISDLRFSSELHDRVLVLPDLRKLYNQLNSTPTPILHTHKERENEKNGFDLIDSFLEQHPEDSSEIEELLDTPTTPPAPAKATDEQTENTEDLINAFLTLGHKGEEITFEEKKEAPAASPITKESESRNTEDELFTETLARMYIKQGKYERAERTLAQINLEFPKKSGYFAEQLNFLRKLIKINEFKSGKEL